MIALNMTCITECTVQPGCQHPFSFFLMKNEMNYLLFSVTDIFDNLIFLVKVIIANIKHHDQIQLGRRGTCGLLMYALYTSIPFCML